MGFKEIKILFQQILDNTSMMDAVRRQIKLNDFILMNGI